MKISGVRLKELRQAKGLRVIDLANAADLGERRIAQYEAGKLVNVNLNIAKALARCLRVKVEELI